MIAHLTVTNVKDLIIQHALKKWKESLGFACFLCILHIQQKLQLIFIY